MPTKHEHRYHASLVSYEVMEMRSRYRVTPKLALISL